jgi:hypothetical protein
MIARYPSGFSVFGARVNRRIVILGVVVGAFALTLAATSGLSGFWHAAGPAAAPVLQPAKGGFMADPAVAPPVAAPPAASTTSAPVQTPPTVAPAAGEAAPSDPQYDQRVNPGVDTETIRRDRGVQRTSRSN